ncbi:MAG: HNH endonuclease, partial [Nitrosopumilales archaeon]
NLANEAQRICPFGSYLGKDTFGNQVCLDSKTNQVVSNPQTSSPIFNGNTLTGIVVFFIIIIVIGGIIKGARKPKQETYYSPDLQRHGWTEIEKEKVRERQNGRCRKCERPPPRWEYHHRDGNRSNNNLSNCEGLCPNCHSLETHEN